MNNRRAFLRNTTALGIGSLMIPSSFEFNFNNVNEPGIGLFSLPTVLEKDFRKGMELLANMGYKKIEFYGPYTFSSEKQKQSWANTSKMVGFSGSGFFGNDAKQTKNILNDYKLSCPSMHTDLDTLRNHMGPLSEAAHIVGATYVTLPSIPDEERKNLDAYKRMAVDFNKIGESAKKHGIRFAYHNHGYGFSEMEGQIPTLMLLNQTDPSLVYLQMDLFWTVAGGADPIKLFKENKGRYKLMHVKDMKSQARFAGDGGNAQQWIALWDEMTTVGDGVLDLKNILAAAKANGMEHFIIEQDIVKNPEIALKRSVDNFKKLVS
jgi:sugar phosphate isomerase/epimerase